jgi:hypothetical protein
LSDKPRVLNGIGQDYRQWQHGRKDILVRDEAGNGARPSRPMPLGFPGALLEFFAGLGA